jgi:hypothetical protein
MTTTTQTQELQNLYELLLTTNIDNYWIAYYTSKNYDNFWEQFEAAVIEKYVDIPLEMLNNEVFYSANLYFKEYYFNAFKNTKFAEVLEAAVGIKMTSDVCRFSSDKLCFYFKTVYIVTDLNGVVLSYEKNYANTDSSIDGLATYIIELQTIQKIVTTNFIMEFIADNNFTEDVKGFMVFIDQLNTLNNVGISQAIKFAKWEKLVSKGNFVLGSMAKNYNIGVVYLCVGSITNGKADCCYVKRSRKKAGYHSFTEDKTIEYSAKSIDALFKLCSHLI